MSSADDAESIITAKDDEIRELRELNAELLDALKDIPNYKYCLPSVIIVKARKVIAKTKELGY